MSRWRPYSIELALVAILIAAVGFFAYLGTGLMRSATSAQEFTGRRALEQTQRQVDFGPRVTGTDDSKAMSDWLAQELVRLNWNVVLEPFTLGETVQARNIIAYRASQTPNAPALILGAHYDSRLAADADPDAANHNLPTPGANGGASGTAILLELARTLDVSVSGHTVCLVFFDADDNGGLPGWEPNRGAQYFLDRLDDVSACTNPRLAVIVDLAGNTNQQIYKEQTSDPALSDAIWQSAAGLGFDDRLRNEVRGPQTSAHTRFLAAGIRAAVIADFGYAYRHTLEDTPDKLNADSFTAVGRALEVWLESGAPLAN